MIYHGRIQDLQRSGDLPERAGSAHLKFQILNGLKRGYEGLREEDVIRIQALSDSIFIGGLSGGTQCLVVPKLQHAVRWGPAKWAAFFGQDENPFHTRIDREVAGILMIEGEDAFYDALKPPKIKALERRWRIPARRQGDIWAIKTPFGDWKTIVDMSLAQRGQCVTVQPGPNGVSVFGTRHDVVGTLARYDGETEFGAGTLVQRPDHADMDISDGIYLLMRSAHLRGLWRDD